MRSPQRRFAILFFVLGILLVAAPLIAPRDPLETNPGSTVQAPNSDYPFGTDLFGRDVLSRTLHGGQRTIGIALLATLIALSAGLMMGLAAGYRAGSWADWVISAIVDALLALPTLAVALMLITVLGSGGWQVGLVIGIAQIAGTARVVRNSAALARQTAYVEAAVSLGATPVRILRSHLLPSILPVVGAYAAAVFSYSLINSAALTFLGLGGEPAIPDWGAMLHEGRTLFRNAPWVAIFPGASITGVVLLVQWAARAFQQTH